jgi:hypothetical protein
MVLLFIVSLVMIDELRTDTAHVDTVHGGRGPTQKK